MKSNSRLSKTILLLVLTIVLCLHALLFTTGEAGEQAELAFKAEASKKEIEPLPIVGTEENLKKILEEAFEENEYSINIEDRMNDGRIAIDKAANATTSAVAAEASSAKVKENASSVDYSTTNIQVEGVDEADIVKTDGKYIYQVNGSRIVIAEAYPEDKLSIKKIIDLEKEEMQPLELYVDSKYLVVIGSSGNSIPVFRKDNNTSAAKRKSIYRDRTVKLMIYNIEDKNKIEEMREIELEGRYLSSRKIESKLYLVANKRIDYYRMMKQNDINYTPSYRDTAVADEFKNIDYNEIAYFPDCLEPNYMIVAGLNLDTPKEGVNVATYLGSGENIYASENNLYTAVSKRNLAVRKKVNPVIYDSAVSIKVSEEIPEKETVVYRFAMDNGKVNYTGKGVVPGYILNQFSMDENKGYFRIATTKGDMWRTDENTSKNNLYILDEDLNIYGKLEDIAPGEKIYSVRFMGDRAYMVTFKKVDPLFVIDLKDAKDPRILGALKIPGYSDYLHPYDENHIIGFGKDTVEVIHKDRSGNPIDSTAYYLGIKMAVFDVSDVNNPKEKFKEVIGDRGTDSELLSDHKALLFSREKNLLAFPINVAEVTGEQMYQKNGIPVSGSFVFQGAYVYNLDLKDGFRLKGKISHISRDEYLKSGQNWYDSEKNINRIIYIGDNLYTLSNSMIKVNDINSMEAKGALPIPQ